MKAEGSAACSKQRFSPKFPKLDDVPTNILQENRRTENPTNILQKDLRIEIPIYFIYMDRSSI